MILKKNIAAGKINFIVFFLYFVLILQFTLKAEEHLLDFEGKFIELKILDKISSKNNLLKGASFMVNYKYDNKNIEKNHEQYTKHNRVIVRKNI